MRVLVGCEYSGVVRDAFLERGHDAVSCDVIETRSEGPHIQGHVLDVIRSDRRGFDLVLSFPPCTYLSAASPLNWRPTGQRKFHQDRALRLALSLLNVPARIGVCVENPQGLLNRYVRPSQIINPFLFGHPIRKRTCLWLRGLPPLVPTQVVAVDWEQSAKWWGQGGRTGRGQHRARTFEGVAAAMAQQWGALKEPFLSPLGV